MLKLGPLGIDMCARAVRCDRIDSYPAGDVDDNRAPDVHRAECIERRTISVEPGALHNGFRYQVPPRSAYPSKVHIYKPLSMPTLQTRTSSADCAVADVPGAIAVTRLTNAHAKSKEVIMRLTNFIFISLISFYLVLLVLALFDSSS